MGDPDRYQNVYAGAASVLRSYLGTQEDGASTVLSSVWGFLWLPWALTSRRQAGDERAGKVHPLLNHLGPEKLSTLFQCISKYYIPETTLHWRGGEWISGGEPAVSATGVDEATLAERTE